MSPPLTIIKREEDEITEHVARIGVIRNVSVNKPLDATPAGKRPFGRPRRRW
jgi:hypothetical protein